MIFLSHNHKDKGLVEEIAKRLLSVYGQDKVFYDSWSIQPGDGIIDKMNSGLKMCKFFFFFISKNSLQSNMVKLEWQNALIKTTKGECKFIPVRIDNCSFPYILMQALYIDIYENGLDVGVRQIVDVIDEKNTFRPNEKFHNIIAYIKKSPKKFVIEIKPQYYMEPISKYAILISNQENEVKWNVKTDSVCSQGFNADIALSDGTICNAIYIEIFRATTPDFPLIVEISPKTNTVVVNVIGVLEKVNSPVCKCIPIVFN
jgi:hypothetical protein